MMTKQNSPLPKRGVYFLADDMLYEMALAFLNSFRVHNPEIALCLIPYNDQTAKVKALSGQYRFTVMERRQDFEICDEISRHFHEKTVGAYRKLVMWDGIFDEFIFIDADTVVLSNIDFVFELLADYDIITSHSNCPGLRRWVWKDSMLKTNKLSPEQVEYSAITGFIASKKSVLSLPVVSARLAEAEELRPHMELTSCMEQPFLNYFFVTSNCRYTSLVVLSWQTRYQAIKYEKWVGSLRGFAYKGKLYFAGRRAVLLVHWAGQWRPARFDRFWWWFTTKLGFPQIKRNVRFFMRHKRLWEYYRYMTAPAPGHKGKGTQ